MILVLLVACGDPCDGFGGTDVSDEGLEADLADWLAWTGADGVCIERVEVADVADDSYELWPGATWTLQVDPDVEDPRRALFGGLCEAWDLREDMSGRAEEVLVDESAATLYQYWCEVGPRDFGQVDPVEAACGETGLTAWGDFLRDEVYPNAPAPRRDGDLSAALTDELRLPGLSGEDRGVSDIVQAGDGVALLAWDRVDDVQTWRVLLVDLATAETTEVLSVPDGGSPALYGGPDGAVLYVDGTLHVIDADGVVSSLSVTLDRTSWRGGVSDGLLWQMPDLNHGVPFGVDLSSGDVVEIVFPEVEAPLEVVVNGFATAPGGFVAELLTAEIVRDGDMVTIGIHDVILARWDQDAAAWTELARDFRLGEAGVTDEGLLVGTLWGEAGDVLGAYDLEGDRLLVSDDLCLDTLGQPTLVADGRAWIFASDGDDHVLRGITSGE